MAIESYELSDRYLVDEGQVFLTGIQALARLPLDQLRADRRAGLNTAAFISGYQGSPFGGYDETVEAAARLAPDLPVVVGPDQRGAGGQRGDGQPARPDAAGRPLRRRARHLVRQGAGRRSGGRCAAPCRLHRVGPKRWRHRDRRRRPGCEELDGPVVFAGLLFDMHVPVLYPGDAGEALLLGRHAIALSRATGLWAALKIVADVADATATVELHPDGFDPVIPLVDGEPYEHSPDGRLLTPHTIDLEREIVEVRYELATRYASANRLNEVTVDAPGHGSASCLRASPTARCARRSRGSGCG